METSSKKFFLYARKSTDVEDKQVLSIEAQLAELRAFATQNHVTITEELIEKQSAKIPGRPIFNDMLNRIEQGEASGIVAWHPDRLARNSVDGGKIIYLLDCGHIDALKFPQFWFEPTPQGKFMLNIAFGQSKYYVDSLAENTKRGLRQKVRRGEFPSLAPTGYLNNLRSKTVIPDKRTAPLIQQAFEIYSKNNSRLEDIIEFLAQHGLTSRNGKRLSKDRISFILSNPFYVGLFRYGGELHEGIHQPIISKKLFDKVQTVLQQRGRPQTRGAISKPYTGLLRCGACKMMITAEIQKGHTYYRCTRKSKAVRCTEPYIREEVVNEQLSSLLQTVSLREAWARNMRELLHEDKQNSAHASAAFVQETRTTLQRLTIKLQRLLDTYLDQDIDRDTYRHKKAILLSEKKSLEERLTTSEQKRIGWLEPFEKWIGEAADMPQIAQEGTPSEKKGAAEKAFGSNLRLAGRNISGEAIKPWQFIVSAQAEVGKKPERSIAVPG